MDRRGKPKKGKAEAKRRHVRKSPKDPAGKVGDLEKRLAEALQREAEAVKREAEAVEQQTATGEILRVISGSPTDAQPVFDAIVRSTARLCDAPYKWVYRVQDELIHFAAARHSSPEAQARVEQW